MKNAELVKVKIERQGAPIVHTDNAYIHAKGRDVVAICVDLKSKYCQVDAIGTSNDERCDAIFVGANKSSIHLKKGADVNDCTKIYFPQYAGWKFFSGEISRYTLRVCLTKK